MKIGLNENNIKYYDLEEVTIDGVVYLKQNISIKYNSNPNQSKLVLGIVTNHLLYDGNVYIDNLTFYDRKVSSSALADDDYIDWYLEREEKSFLAKRRKTLMIAIGIPSLVGGIGAGVGINIFIFKKKKKIN
ncbi:MAG: hypothetical protein GX794_02600 [Acholeplasmataceae bacterium]|nr:hypothetical protein [Acholeplasmataceae bacterium]